MNQSNSGFLSSIPVVTRNIIIINAIIWLAQVVLLQRGLDLRTYLGLNYILSDNFMPHQFVTYMFLHDPSGIMHVLFNMFAVFMFGRTLEHYWGAKKFMIYYLLTGLGAALAQEIVYTIELRDLIFNSSIEMINTGVAIITKQEFYNLFNTVGASGAVFGILVAFGMMFPNAELMMIPIPIPIKAKWFVLGYGILELSLGFMNRSGDNVAHFAHLGGLLVGFIIMMSWRKSNKRYNDKLF